MSNHSKPLCRSSDDVVTLAACAALSERNERRATTCAADIKDAQAVPSSGAKLSAIVATRNVSGENLDGDHSDPRLLFGGADRGPVNIGAQLFAKNHVACFACGTLNAGAVIGRDAGGYPRLDGLVFATIREQQPGGTYWAAKDGDSPLGGLLLGRFLGHAPSYASLTSNASNSCVSQISASCETSGMSIHEQIKTRRLALRLSMDELCGRIQEIEGAKKKMAWQTVQQWERPDGTAPKRTRLEAVAKALETTVAALSQITPEISAEPSDLSAAWGLLSPPQRAIFLRAMQEAASESTRAAEAAIAGQLTHSGNPADMMASPLQSPPKSSTSHRAHGG